jgi:hypothetical protein
MSTITAPGFMSFIMSRRTSLGTETPGINTAPITKSASRIALRTVHRFDAGVLTCPL